MVFILLLHYLGLGGVIAASFALGMYDLAIINSVAFLTLIGAERALCAKRYTAPMPVWINAPVEWDEFVLPTEKDVEVPHDDEVLIRLDVMPVAA